jgi:hypothetical protein
MAFVRPPAVAGLFYNNDAAALRAEVAAYIDAADVEPRDTLRAAIGPHAGYPYSGPICGATYAALARRRDALRRVVLVGPSHRVPFSGLATTTADAFATPIGEVPVDREGIKQLQRHPAVAPHDDAHAPEHALEVHLPFLQVALNENLPIVPLLFSDVSASDTAEALRPLFDEQTLLMVSSDLSHYHDYEEARQIDRATADAIEHGNVAALTGATACGHVAIQAMMLLAGDMPVAARTLDLRSSGDTAGPRDRVVGYGAFVYD